MPARYYDPASARFVSVDPAAPSAGDPVSLNGYSYCFGDPVNFSDPTGALIDTDGNGKADAHDASREAATHTKDPARKAALIAQSNVEYAGFHGAQEVLQAKRELEAANRELARLNLVGGIGLAGGYFGLGLLLMLLDSPVCSSTEKLTTSIIE